MRVLGDSATPSSPLLFMVVQSLENDDIRCHVQILEGLATSDEKRSFHTQESIIALYGTKSNT